MHNEIPATSLHMQNTPEVYKCSHCNEIIDTDDKPFAKHLGDVYHIDSKHLECFEIFQQKVIKTIEKGQ